jgi:hypothetical protein
VASEVGPNGGGGLPVVLGHCVHYGLPCGVGGAVLLGVVDVCLLECYIWSTGCRCSPRRLQAWPSRVRIGQGSETR